MPATLTRLQAVQVKIFDDRRMKPRVRRIAAVEHEEIHRLGAITYQFPDLDAALRWVAGYCGPGGCAVRELLHDLRIEEEDSGSVGT